MSESVVAKPRYVLVSCDDWQGLYRDGQLVIEKPRISLTELAVAAGLDYENFYSDRDWPGVHGGLPMDLGRLEA